MNRRDGIKVKDLDGMHSLMLEIMPKRCDSDVYISAKIDVTNLIDYVNKLNFQLMIRVVNRDYP